MRSDAEQRAVFLALSALLTGFDAIDLEGTGLVDTHCSLIRDVVGSDLFDQFMMVANDAIELPTVEARDRALRGRLLGSATFGPLGRNLIALWYLGQWDALPDGWFATNHLVPTTANATHLPAGAYEEALAYRAFGAHPPGAKPPGHGSWSSPPVLEDGTGSHRFNIPSTRQ